MIHGYLKSKYWPKIKEKENKFKIYYQSKRFAEAAQNGTNCTWNIDIECIIWMQNLTECSWWWFCLKNRLLNNEWNLCRYMKGNTKRIDINDCNVMIEREKKSGHHANRHKMLNRKQPQRNDGEFILLNMSLFVLVFVLIIIYRRYSGGDVDVRWNVKRERRWRVNIEIKLKTIKQHRLDQESRIKKSCFLCMLV